MYIHGNNLCPTTNHNQRNPYKERVPQNMCVNEDLPYKERLSAKKQMLALLHYKNPKALINQGTDNSPQL